MYVIKLDTEYARNLYGGYYGKNGFGVIDNAFVFDKIDEAQNFIEKEIKEIEHFRENCCDCEQEEARLVFLKNCLLEFSLIGKNEGFMYPQNHKPVSFSQKVFKNLAK